MTQAAAALLGAILTAAACYSAGALLIGLWHIKLRRSERFPLAFILGAACLHLAIFLVLALHVAYWPVLVAMLLLISAAGLRPVPADPAEPLDPNVKRFWAVLFGAFTLLYFFNALAPESSPDGSGYHLGLVARYFHAHGFERITTNMYAALSAGVEMLYVPAFAIGRHSAAALVHFSFAIALALAMFAYGRRLGKPWVGAAGALLTYASPIVGVDGSSAYNDVAVAAIVFGVFYWLQIWDENRDKGTLYAVGLLAGYAYAAKYTAFVMVPFAVAFVAWRARSIKPLIPVVGLASVMILPWMLKDWIILGNPIAPFGNQFFRNPNFHVLSMQEYAEYLRHYELTDKRALPLEVTIRGEKTQGVIGVTFLAAPIALAALRFRAGRRLLAAGAVMLVSYFANIGTRFLIPSLPFFSLAMALALGDRTAVLAALMVFHAASSWPLGLRRYAGHYAWQLHRIPFKEALRKIPPDRYLRENDPGYAAARMIDANVPKDEAVLAFYGVAEAYTSREILVGYQAAPNETLTDILNVGWIRDYQPTIQQSFTFPSETLERIRVVQTKMGAPLRQWSIHELRFYNGGMELPRNSSWRLRAWPNPWEVQLAFDNSPATRWRTWERAAPGMYVDVDLGKPAAMDEVRIETSIDGNGLAARVEALDEGQKWRVIAREPVLRDIEPPESIRHAATYELRQRGIHYLLVHNSDAGADDFRDDPDGWGMKEIAAIGDVRLYRVE